MNSPEYISPIDGHRHYGEQGRAGCAICILGTERDRWRAAFDRIALDPAEYRHALGHVVDCEDNCESCRSLARQALAGGVDAQERAADILIERDRLRATIRDALVEARAARDAVNEPEDCFASVIEERLAQLDGAREATDG